MVHLRGACTPPPWNLDTVGPDGKVPFERWRGRGHHMGRCVFGDRVWYRVGPLTDRTKAEGRMEPGIFVGFRMKSSKYILIANGEATTARTIRRRPVPERWTKPDVNMYTPMSPSLYPQLLSSVWSILNSSHMSCARLITHPPHGGSSSSA